MVEAKPVTTPIDEFATSEEDVDMKDIPYQSAVGSLMYAMGTIDIGLKYTRSDYSKIEVEGYCDSNYAGDLTKRRSLTGYMFMIGGNLVQQF
ncbi:secreted RxLR effector protein 161-like [Pistacia vera]|uniref:secreted RxLR effector protein 161-like n=1 Tax=Pistacia vera TaxID=55513 RepID=UPI0012632451|nr:secreted RxLR effector protein 161-like [Pistacia vera]